MKLLGCVLSSPADTKACIVYNASPMSTTSHQELFSAATRYYSGRALKPIHFPKFPALLGVAARQWIGSLTGRMPFERIWMMRYIDKKLTVDAQKTDQALNWPADTPL